MTSPTGVPTPAHDPPHRAPHRAPRTPGELLRAVFGLVRTLLARPLADYYLLVAVTAALLVFGLVMVYSATSVQQFATSGSTVTSIGPQAIAAAIGVGLFLVCQRLPERRFRALAGGALVTVLVLVALPMLLGTISSGRLGPLRSDGMWFYLGQLQFQPSELAKAAFVIWVANVLARMGERAGAVSDLARPLFPVASLLFVLVGYRDLGTMVCLFVMFVGLLWAAGVRARVFAGMFAVVGLGVLALVLLPGSDYRLARVTAFLHPERDPLGAGYQHDQGLAAIASGGWFGVGLGEGRFKWGYLPAAHNDFIFAVIGEELGVVGCLLVLALFGVLTWTGLRIARRVTTAFRRLAAAGVVALVAGQVIINIAGVAGLVPVTGLPLPMISDGGTAIVVTLALLGMLASFARAEPAAVAAVKARPPGPVGRLLWAPHEDDRVPSPGASQRAPDASASSGRQRVPQSRPTAAPRQQRTFGAGRDVGR